MSADNGVIYTEHPSGKGWIAHIRGLYSFFEVLQRAKKEGKRIVHVCGRRSDVGPPHHDVLAVTPDYAALFSV